MGNFVFPFPFFPVQFTKEGAVFQQSDVTALTAGIQSGVTDLFVLAHGWNNNMDDAKGLYAGLMTQQAAQMANVPALAGRSFAICGVLWPSKKFDDQELIPSGAASLNDAVSGVRLRARLDGLSGLIQAKGWPMETADPAAQARIDSVKQSIGDWENQPAVRRDVVVAIRALLPRNAASTEDASDRFLSMNPDQLLTNLSRALNPPPNVPHTSGASLDPFSTGAVSGLGGAASFRDVLGGINSAFLHLLNFTTYYLMKARAGDVGVNGVKPLIETIRAARPPLRIHLIGHSFGCRVITSAVSALGTADALKPNTMSLLQGAFSHNGFSSNFNGSGTDGAFRNVVAQKKVRGPILISHTRNDKAVGVAYPIASRIAGQAAAALGDENDIFGGMGSNGAQNQSTTPERVVGTMLDPGGSYPFAAGATSSKPYNLKADAFITGHSDIVRPQVAFAVAVAMASPDSN